MGLFRGFDLFINAMDIQWFTLHPWTEADSVRAERPLRREKHRGRSHKPSLEHMHLTN